MSVLSYGHAQEVSVQNSRIVPIIPIFFFFGNYNTLLWIALGMVNNNSVLLSYINIIYGKVHL